MGGRIPGKGSSRVFGGGSASRSESSQAYAITLAGGVNYGKGSFWANGRARGSTRENATEPGQQGRLSLMANSYLRRWAKRDNGKGRCAAEAVTVLRLAAVKGG